LKRAHYSESHVAAKRVKLRILATTDLHMHILPYDYLAGRMDYRWGLANTASLIHDARQDVKNTVLLDNGDFLHGTPIGDLAAEMIGACLPNQIPDTHPMITAMNHLRYDVVTLGNHDFDRGVDVLRKAVEPAGFPIVSANAVTEPGPDPTQDTTFVPPYVILDKEVEDDQNRLHKLRIGVIGFLPPGLLMQNNGNCPVPKTRDIVETARAYIPEIRRNGADIVIALAHSGIGDSNHVPNMENALLPLSRIDGLDAIIGGHSHMLFPCGTSETGEADNMSGTLNGVPTVMPGYWGSHLGIIDLKLKKTGKTWSVEEHDVSLRESGAQKAELPPELTRFDISPASKPVLSSLVGPLHESTLTHMRRSFGRCSCDLDNYFALVGADSATRLVKQAIVDYAMRMKGQVVAEDLPIIASSAPFKSGGFGGPDYYTSVAAGDITLRSISDLYVFPNQIALVRATGSYMRDWLERSVSIFNQVLPGEKRVALKEDTTPGYLLESVFGLTYGVDLSQPARYTTSGSVSGLGAGRIVNLCHNGKSVEEDDEFLFATSDFRVRGGGGYPVISECRIVQTPPATVSDVLRCYVEREEIIDVSLASNWHFTPISQASIRFKSSPLAQGAIDKYPGLNLALLEEQDHDGFSHFEMAL